MLAERRRTMQALAKSLGLDVQDLEKFNKAFIHTSYSNENDLAEYKNNERLEFLGDSVLGFLVSEYLYQHSKTMREGELSKLKARVVCQKVLARLARELGLGNSLLLGRGEELSGGRFRDSILADCFEAVVGAIYLTCGIEEARKFIHGQLVGEINRAKKGKGEASDHKSKLQELIQKEMNQLPRYRVVKADGPDHDPTFEVEVTIQDHILGVGQGKNKKDAEQLAAQQALENTPAVLNEIRSADSLPAEGCGEENG